MARYQTSIPSPRSAPDAFDYMADFRNAPRWDPNTSGVEAVSGTPGQPGSTYRVTTRFGGRELVLTYETLEVDRPRRVVLRADSPTATIQDTITVTPVGSGSEIDYEATISPRGALKVLDPVLGLIFSRVGDRAKAGLERELGPPAA